MSSNDEYYDRPSRRAPVGDYPEVEEDNKRQNPSRRKGSDVPQDKTNGRSRKPVDTDTSKYPPQDKGKSVDLTKPPFGLAIYQYSDSHVLAVGDRDIHDHTISKYGGVWSEKTLPQPGWLVPIDMEGKLRQRYGIPEVAPNKYRPAPKRTTGPVGSTTVNSTLNALRDELEEPQRGNPQRGANPQRGNPSQRRPQKVDDIDDLVRRMELLQNRMDRIEKVVPLDD
jgi:hypothetical protein